MHDVVHSQFLQTPLSDEVRKTDRRFSGKNGIRSFFLRRLRRIKLGDGGGRSKPGWYQIHCGFGLRISRPAESGGEEQRLSMLQRVFTVGWMKLI